LPNTALIDQAARYRTALERSDAETMRKLADAYNVIYRRLLGDIDALSLELAALDNPTREQVKQLQRYRRLLTDTAEQLNRYGVYVDTESSAASRLAVEVALRDTRTLARLSAGTDAILAEWKTLNPQVVETLTGYLDDTGPLYKAIRQIAPDTVQSVADAILEGVGYGRNPKDIATRITNALGMGLTDSMRLARTVQIYSYREASRANYIANSDIVIGWWWMSALKSETCVSCIAMHGTFHGLDETLNDHYNGLCTAVPATVTNEKTPFAQTGEQWFESLSAGDQRAYMGPGRYDAWKAGKFSFSDLTTTHDDDVFGEMRTATPLKDLES